MTVFLRFSTLVVAIACTVWASAVAIACPMPTVQADGSAQARSAEIAALVSLVHDVQIQKSDPECTTTAIYRLGGLKATEAMPDLAALLGFRRKLPSDDSAIMIHPILEESHYPAVEALINIGKPALPVLVNVISIEGTMSARGHNALHSVLQILRDFPPDAVKLFDKAALTARSPESRANLTSARAEALKWCSLGESARGYACQ